MSEGGVLWSAKDADGCEATLDQAADGRFQLSLDGGCFSGYPVIDLDAADLRSLRDAISTIGAA